mmetsp:Transcript_31744/g.71187  ORF Transcript_31744/g.71187 Transcript_31744/m.71187 type:complete len:281 (-) Transcript_31744:1048-1890(-)
MTQDPGTSPPAPTAATPSNPCAWRCSSRTRKLRGSHSTTRGPPSPPSQPAASWQTRQGACDGQRGSGRASQNTGKPQPRVPAGVAISDNLGVSTHHNWETSLLLRKCTPSGKPKNSRSAAAFSSCGVAPHPEATAGSLMAALPGDSSAGGGAAAFSSTAKKKPPQLPWCGNMRRHRSSPSATPVGNMVATTSSRAASGTSSKADQRVPHCAKSGEGTCHDDIPGSNTSNSAPGNARKTSPHWRRTADTTASFSTGFKEQVEYTNLPPGASCATARSNNDI